MKKLNKLLFFLLLIVLPICVFAASKRSYAVSRSAVGNYLNSNNYINSWEKYLEDPANLGEQLIISENEYNATKNSRGGSYLLDEKACWTSTSENGKQKVIVLNGGTSLKSVDEYYYVRTSEYILPGTVVRGSGSYNNPWSFAPVYKVAIETTKEGEIQASGVSTLYVTKGSDAILGPINAKPGYMYITNNCAGNYNYDNDNVNPGTNRIKINHVTKDVYCKLIFGTGKFKLTLNGANPLEIFLKYKDNYYTNANYNVPIRKIESVPIREGYEFKGYYYNEFQVVDENLNVKRDSANKIHENATLNPKYDIGDLTAETTITGGQSIIYNKGQVTNGTFVNDKVTLTCSNTTQYDSQTQMFYEFGRKRTSATEYTWLGNASTSPTLNVSSKAFRGIYEYTCRVYAQDGENKTPTVAATAPSNIELAYARVDFDVNGGTKNGGNSTVYVPYYSSNKYTGRTNTSSAVYPTVSKEGYQFMGWFTQTSGGTKVLDSDGVLVSNVPGWTKDGNWALTNNSSSSGTHKLYAQYDGNTYVATFNKNGATSIGSSSLSCKVTSGSTCSITLPTITRSGFTIAGWNTSASAKTGTAASQSITLSSNKTYYAITHKDVTITFNRNNNTNQTVSGGSASTETTVKQSCEIWNSSTTCSITSPTITAPSGFTVNGYSSSATTYSNYWKVNTSKAVSANATWYAQSTKAARTITITFNKNGNTSQTPSGGSKSENNTLTQTCTMAAVHNGATQSGCSITSPTIGAPSGFTVNGYSTGPTTYSNYWTVNTAKTFTSNATYYAQSTKAARTITITFNRNGNTNQTVSGGSASTANTVTGTCNIAAVHNGATQASSCKVTSPTIGAPSGFSVIGYSTGASTRTNSWSQNTQKNVSENATYYAQSSKAARTFTVTFKKNTATYLHSGALSTPVYSTPESELVTEDIKETCDAAKVYNGATQSCTITAPTARKVAYRVVGFNTSSTATTSSWSALAEKNISANATYYAIMTPVTVTVRFNGNGGKIAKNSTQTFTGGTANQKFADTGATRSGYTLDGWLDPSKKDATTKNYPIHSDVIDKWIDTVYYKEATTINGVSEYNGSITLYALWIMNKPNKPTVTNSSSGNWTNQDVKLTYKTTSPSGIIGKWYWKYGSDAYAVWSGKDGKTTFDYLYDYEINKTLTVMVCNTKASGSSDTTNCSEAVSTNVKIDKTKPNAPKLWSGFQTTSTTGNRGTYSVPYKAGGSCTTGASVCENAEGKYDYEFYPSEDTGTIKSGVVKYHFVLQCDCYNSSETAVRNNSIRCGRATNPTKKCTRIDKYISKSSVTDWYYLEPTDNYMGHAGYFSDEGGYVGSAWDRFIVSAVDAAGNESDKSSEAVIVCSKTCNGKTYYKSCNDSSKTPNGKEKCN